MKTTRTNIVLSDDLVEEAMQLSKAATKREMIENAIEAYIRGIKRKQLADLHGKIKWEGDLAKMRQGRFS
ncbi:MAG TPA: type II toxin-antitoxin system VapB family antitoxin [Cyclobacteriaceae bacterium]|nr:type II toxin-antitoxin system VapB family antitoxin [Cyclobacteriaceae bacterium]